MSRRFATVRKISEIRAIPNAERVELACVDGWRAVIPKNTYKDGEYVLFIETDAALINVDDPRFDFLRKSCLKQWKNSQVLFGECLRVRTIKLAGQISQGLVLKLADFPEAVCSDDIDAVLCIKHFDELAEEMAAKTGKIKQADAAGSFPSFIPKTDEERIQNMPEVLTAHKDTLFEVTLKLDGSSMSVGYSPSNYPDDPFFVCSRNLRLKRGDNTFHKVAAYYDIENKLKQYYDASGEELCLQGELIGPGINGNRGKQENYSFNVFRVWSISDKKWLETEDWRFLCEHKFSIPTVPRIDCAYRPLNRYTTVDELVEFAKKAMFNGLIGEGYVFKSYDGDTHFKVINPMYLLEEK